MNNLFESDHAAMKQRLGCSPSLRPLRSAKAALSVMGTIRKIKRGNFHHKWTGALGEILIVAQLFNALPLGTNLVETN